MADIVIYSTPTCVYCRMAKAYLAEKNIPFADKNVAVDDKAREEMIKKSRQMGVPVIDINGTIIVGFDKPKINSLLGIS